MSKRLIEGINLVKEYDGARVVDNIDFWVKTKEFLTILGPSGCGKTTTLRMIGGFETPTSGDILLNGQSIVNLPPYSRPINTVFQKYALFPHMSIYDNIAFGLHIKKMAKSEIDKRVSKMLHLVNLDGFEKRRVNSLSGGQQQRIFLARAFAQQPRMLLMDEPFNAVDLKTEEIILDSLHDFHAQGVTTLIVTHDLSIVRDHFEKVILLNDRELAYGPAEEIMVREKLEAVYGKRAVIF